MAAQALITQRRQVHFQGAKLSSWLGRCLRRRSPMAHASSYASTSHTGIPEISPHSLLTATGKGDADLPWLQVWRYLSEAIRDDEGTTPGRRPTNRSNRFEVANQINSLLSVSSEAAGPFWCGGSEAHRYIPPKRPPQPFQTAQGYTVKPLRLTDERARSGTPFRLFGTASVGSQSLRA